MKNFSILTRRKVLHFLGGTAAASLVGCLRNQSTSVQAQSSVPNCVVKPEQTEGPFFVDERLNRSDVRSDPTDSSIKQGVPLRLAFEVSQLSASTCTPLKDAIVDIWHCDAEGNYSDVGETAGKKFLRGYQTTNANGTAEFVTIYPGWYPGRTVHIHFKIRTNSGAEFTSQLYFDDALTDQVHAQAPYSSRGQRTQRNDRDGIYRGGGEQLMLQLTKAEEGYVGRFAIALS